MNILSTLGLGAAPACDTENLHNLLVAVLPTFVDLAETTWNRLDVSLGSTTMTDFYLNLKVKMFSLHAFLDVWDPTEQVQRLSADENEVQKNLMRILKELESRFLSWKDNKVESAARRLGLKRRNDESYPKLRALKRILPEDGNNPEELVIVLTTIVRLDNRRADKREQFLQSLDQALGFFHSLHPMGEDLHSPCPIRFENYPLKHMWKLSKMLFDVIQKSWFCRCNSSPAHASRRTRLNLTYHQRFETSPPKGQLIPKNKALFRILFPIGNSRDAEWQDTEIAVRE